MRFTYRYYVLAVLFLVYVLNFVDRQILAILLPLIKADLGLSDTQLGFLSGFAFALFYVTLGFPIAWLADRKSRRAIIACAVALWSSMTMLTGLASSFVHLALLRVGVGIGEAGCTPPAHSLISSYFKPSERGAALGVYNLGFSVGVLIAFSAGGWIGEILGWRTAFFIAGSPGLFIGVLVWLSVREPPRLVEEYGRAKSAPTIREVIRFLLAQKSFLHLAAAASLTNLAYIGVLQWLPSFFVRSHGLATGEIGIWLAFNSGIVGGIGTLAGGILADRWGKRDWRWYMWLPGLGMLVATPFIFGAMLVTQSNTAFVLLAVPAFLVALGVAPIYALTQSLAEPRMRAMAAATMLFCINLLGLGLGPQLIGMLSDALAPLYGAESLRYAIVWVATIGTLWPVAHFFLGAQSLAANLQRAGSA